MANKEQLEILQQGVETWNQWRKREPSIKIDFSEADFKGANLDEANLSRANFNSTNLSGVSLKDAQLDRADLRGADLSGTDLRRAKLFGAKLNGANLRNADLREAYLRNAKLFEADLRGAKFKGADLTKAKLNGANLNEVNLRGAYLSEADLSKAKLRKAKINGVELRRANFDRANLNRSNLSEANLRRANLSGANLTRANLGGADLTEADLSGSIFIGTFIEKTVISGCSIYAINVWDLKGTFAEQKDLIITRKGDPVITVDSIKIAQFIYLILNNEEIRNVLNTLTSKSVLILGRFSIPERKQVLEALRSGLREYNLFPIVFDFDRPTDRDFTETIKILAGLSYFVIADVTNPKSSPLELQATVPDYQTPFVPIIQEGEQPFAMMINLQTKYNWVLDTISYDSLETLIKILKPGIIDPAIEKHNELSLIKAREPRIRSAKDFLDEKSNH